MKKVIGNKVFNTETADRIAEFSNGYLSDLDWWEETLYRTRKGQWFTVGSGGPKSRYARYVETNTVSGSSDVFTLLSNEEAREWLERYFTAETIERYFTVEED